MRRVTMAMALLGILALCAHPAVSAQYNDSQQGNGGQQQGWHGHGHNRMDPDAELQRMTERLGLTASQQKQIRPILVDRQKQMQALFQDDSLSREDRRSQMMTLRQDSNSKIENLLTDEQKQNFEAMQERHGRHGQRGGDNEPQGDPQT